VSACLDDSTLVGFLERALGEEAMGAVRAHVSGCAVCRKLLAAAAQASQDGGMASAPALGDDGAGSTMERGTAVDRYVILDPIGVGAMGVVYAAYHPGLDRRVALKFLRPDRISPGHEAEHRERLLREAKAMARVSHPNVVPVYDAGVHGNDIFVAMELVEGETLRSWLAERRRPWREIIEAFLQAGRGLAAAHAAGIVHRDIKPENLLVAKGGRVLVTDFGLAHADGVSAEAPPSESGSHSVEITRTGFLIGTPAYMAPEQLRGEKASALSDQFSFCVALHEALYGSRPFRSKTLEGLREEMARRVVAEPPGDSPVPAWVRRIIVRGLAAAPSERHPSMQALVDALASDPAARMRRAAAGTAAVVAVAVMALLVGLAAAPDRTLCAGAEAEIGAVWGPAAKKTVRSALLAAGRPHAAEVWRSFESALDGYARGWAEAHTDSCEATRVRGTQSEALLDRRMRCLDEHRESLQGLVEIFSKVEPKRVDQAIRAALALPPLADCSAQSLLRARPLATPDPSKRKKVDAQRARLARVQPLHAVGEFQRGLAESQDILAKSRLLGDAALEAEALYAVGLFQMERRDLSAARKTYEEALHAALASAHDLVAVRSLLDLVWVTGVIQGRRGEARALGRHAAKIIERLDDVFRGAVLLYYLGILSFEDGDYASARERFERALAVHERLGQPGFQWVGRGLAALGLVAHQMGRPGEARDYYRRAVKLLENHFGPWTPDLTVPLNNLANVEEDLAEYGSAMELHRRTGGIAERARGVESLEAATSVANIGVILLRLGNLQTALDHVRRGRALLERLTGPLHTLIALYYSYEGEILTALGEYERALAAHEHAIGIRRKTVGEEHADAADAMLWLASLWLESGRPERALSASQRSLAILERTLPRGHYRAAAALLVVGEALNALNRFPEARGWCERALGIFEPVFGPTHPAVTRTLLALAEGRLAERKPRDAMALLERARMAQEPRRDNPWLLARIRFALARALWAAGTGGERAHGLARQARATFVAIGSRDRRRIEEIDRWLAAVGKR
jgi:tetratricopeptide (TPR) repeat protein/predicted Ser/Thr protein kinase